MLYIEQSIQLRNLMDIFCSTSVRSNALQNSSNDIIPSPFSSASTIVRSAMLVNCSSLQYIYMSYFIYIKLSDLYVTYVLSFM